MQIAQQPTELAIADLVATHEQRFEELGAESSPLRRRQRPSEIGDDVCLGVGERDRHGRIHWRAGVRRVDCASCMLAYWVIISARWGDLAGLFFLWVPEIAARAIKLQAQALGGYF